MGVYGNYIDDGSRTAEAFREFAKVLHEVKKKYGHLPPRDTKTRPNYIILDDVEKES